VNQKVKSFDAGEVKEVFSNCNTLKAMESKPLNKRCCSYCLTRRKRCRIVLSWTNNYVLKVQPTCKWR